LHPGRGAHILERVSDSTTLPADLAAQIRAAVAETARAAPSSEVVSSGGEEDGARKPLQRAAGHLSPNVSAAARLSLFKRLAVRLLRFLWRDQASFNALSLESMQYLLAGLTSQRRSVEQFRAELAGFRRDQGHRRSAVDEMKRTLESWERRLAIEDGRLSALEALTDSRAALPATAAAGAPPPTSIPPGVYSLFEERFRGRPEEITEKQRVYLPLFENLHGPVLDVGCGRGEFLKLLAERGVKASGVESNPIAAAEVRRSGIEVEEGDALAILAQRPPGKLGAVVALQVVEHWAPETIFRFLREAQRVLAPGGLLLLETINTDSLSAWRAFYLDPSHVRPVPPEGLRFLAEAVGFGEARIEWHAPLAADDRLQERGENEIKLNRLLFGPQDYALIAYRPTQERSISH